MNRRNHLEPRVTRWIESGLIDPQTGARILAFEARQERRATLRWPVILAMAFGGLLLAAGVTLFVAAHWDELSPAVRFSLLLLMVGLFHIGGATLADRFPVLSTTLHAVGTVTLGAAIFLTAQIFNLHEKWAAGVLLWAIGAACGSVLLRDWTQAAALALLAPAWLISQWLTIWNDYYERLMGLGFGRPLALGLVLTALCYLSARIGDQEGTTRRTLVWIGGIALLPCVGIAVAITHDGGYSLTDNSHSPRSTIILLLGWTVALLSPLALAWFLRGRAAWMNILGAVWTYALLLSSAHSRYFVGNQYRQSLGVTLILYALCALGAVGLVAWGLYERRKERLNLGIAGFAISVLFFYFDSFMDKLGRSASLLILGFLCLAGGYALEITRRKLMAKMEMSQ